MKNFNKYILCGTIIATLFSCGTYDQILKGRDYQAKYDTALEYYENGKFTRTVALLSQIESIYEGTSKADTVKFYLAKSAYNLASYEESALMLDEFRKTYARSPFAEEAEFLYAMSYYEAAPNYELDQSPTEKAILAFSEYAGRYPNSENSETVKNYMEELQGRLLDKSFEVAYTYYNVSYFNAAITSFKNLLRSYPNHPKKEEVLYLIAKSNYEFAKGSVAKKQRERYYNTIDAGMNFKTQFAESDYTAEIDRMIENSRKLSSRRALLEDTDNASYLTDKEILRNSTFADKLDKKVEDGKLTSGEAEKILSDRIAKTEEHAKRRHERDLSDREALIMMSRPETAEEILQKSEEQKQEEAVEADEDNESTEELSAKDEKKSEKESKIKKVKKAKESKKEQDKE